MWKEVSCTKLQLPPEPLSRGLPPPDPRSLFPLSSTEFFEPPPRNKIPGYATDHSDIAGFRLHVLLCKFHFENVRICLFIYFV